MVCADIKKNAPNRQLEHFKAYLSREAPTSLTFKNRASYIWDGRTATFQMLHFIYVCQQI
jgi:hypothetical protein